MKKKEISFRDFCWKNGFAEWRPISSVHELDRRSSLRSLPPYPSIDVPGGSKQVAVAAPVRHPDHVQVKLAKSTRHSISAYEWAAAVIFSLFFGYLCASYALNEVVHTMQVHNTIQNLGKPVVTGHTESTPVDAEVWAPLWSAPQVETFQNQTLQRAPFYFPQGLPVKIKTQTHSIEKDVDGVYTRTIEQHGVLPWSTPGKFWVTEPGDPRTAP